MKGAKPFFLLVWFAFACFDPRTKGFAPLGGGYEREAISIVTDSPTADMGTRIASLGQRALADTPKLLAVHLPAAFLGQVPTPILGVAISLLLIGSSLLIIRRHPIWALLIVFTSVLGIALIRGTAASCGCFGRSDGFLNRADVAVARNVALLALAIVLIRRKPTSPAAPASPA